MRAAFGSPSLFVATRFIPRVELGSGDDRLPDVLGRWHNPFRPRRVQAVAATFVNEQQTHDDGLKIRHDGPGLVATPSVARERSEICRSRPDPRARCYLPYHDPPLTINDESAPLGVEAPDPLGRTVHGKRPGVARREANTKLAGRGQVRTFAQPNRRTAVNILNRILPRQ